MGDLTDKQAAQSVKIAGADPTSGIESNFAGVDGAGSLQAFLRDAAAAYTTGNISALNGVVSLPLSAQSTVGVNVSGTWVGTISFEATLDGAIWFPIPGYAVGTGSSAGAASANGQFILSAGGYYQIRLRASAWTSGTAAVVLNASLGQNTAPTLNASAVSPQIYSLFSFSTPLFMASQNAENPLILLRNPSGSGIRIMIWQMFVGINVQNVNGIFKVFANPTVTSVGTLETPRARRVGTAGVAAALISSLPVIAALGDQLHAFTIGQNTNAESMVSEFSLTLEPNNAILITGKPSSNNRESAVSVIWTEITL